LSKFGEVFRISVSTEKGSKKRNIDKATLIENSGIEGDAHAGSERQISLLPYEAFELMFEHLPELQPGDFAENITTRKIDFSSASIGDRLSVGDSVQLKITHIGKECHNGCYIKEQVGDCIMPSKGIFASIIKGGLIQVGDKIRLENDND
jgi:MOSC domain-containing protein YiiM